jgi:hypothetical protein
MINMPLAFAMRLCAANPTFSFLGLKGEFNIFGSNSVHPFSMPVQAFGLILLKPLFIVGGVFGSVAFIQSFTSLAGGTQPRFRFPAGVKARILF